MKYFSLILLAAVLSMAILPGCFYAHIKQPLDTDVNRTVLGQKSGMASSYSVLWAAAWGDAGTETAAKNGNITMVNHMDREIYSVFFGIYTRMTTIVYGD